MLLLCQNLPGCLNKSQFHCFFHFSTSFQFAMAKHGNKHLKFFSLHTVTSIARTSAGFICLFRNSTISRSSEGISSATKACELFQPQGWFLHFPKIFQRQPRPKELTKTWLGSRCWLLQFSSKVSESFRLSINHGVGCVFQHLPYNFSSKSGVTATLDFHNVGMAS